MGRDCPEPVLQVEQRISRSRKTTLSGNTKCQAESEEVSGMKHENEQLKQLVAELALKYKVLNKSLPVPGRPGHCGCKASWDRS